VCWAWARAYSTDRGLTVPPPCVFRRRFLLWRGSFLWAGRFFCCGGDSAVGILAAATQAVNG